ncbi:MAG: prolyl oligopeptidase family serine peptidase [Bacteroidales bacterium]|nr:prolyl oligopeptidase family serine peptidase [Bacteroidales bacterium]
MIRNLISLLLLLVVLPFSYGQSGLKYQLPPKEIVAIADAEVTPAISISPDYKTIALLHRAGMVTVADLSREELRIAGLRIDPAVNGPSRSSYYTGISLMNIDGTAERKVDGLPADARLGSFSWSPDGTRAAFTNTTDDAIELWVMDVATMGLKKIASGLNMVFRGSFDWMPDNSSIIFRSVVEGRGPRPGANNKPEGPVVQENLGEMGAARTFQDLLKDENDSRLFEYFATSQITKWNGSGLEKIGAPGMYTGINLSNDGNYMIVDELQRPFSYIVPYSYFPSVTMVWNMDGSKMATISSDPLRENLPRGYDQVFPGRRSIGWRADKPATLLWVEALDGGDPEKEMEYHDQVYTLDLPFTGEPVELIATAKRYGGITWGDENFAILYESSRKERVSLVYSFDPQKPEDSRKLIFELKSDDRYENPGRFMTERSGERRGQLIFADRGRSLFLTGQGASPEGDRPFIDKYDIRTGKTTRLWRSEAPYYESISDLIDPVKLIAITTRQSVSEPPNYFMRNLKNGKLTRITSFDDPYPQMAGVTKEMVKYVRKDGIDLTFDLYLPAGYDKEKDGPLPTIMWAYPREFQSADAAGQVSGSPYTFTRLNAGSILVFVTQGYAILNNATFPIVGSDDIEPNDTFVEQLVMNAEAAIDKAVEMGVTDRNRVAAGGHSYGAFMTANLLAHSRLFATGVAQSGAYNRTLTPFGFQNERRTYWEAPDLYNTMSPFMNAEKVKDPILLIHGMADNNSGTFPIQSERLYGALKGHGAVVRLVELPLESHGYAGRESVLHKQWEIYMWFDKYLKNRKVEE